MNDITLSAGGLVIVTSILGVMATVVTFLFKLLLAAKDDLLKDRDLTIAKRDLELIDCKTRLDKVLALNEDALRATFDDAGVRPGTRARAAAK